MELVTLIGITVALALVLILVGAMVNYMSSLVKSAYQIKVELRNELESSLKDMAVDIDRRAKGLKRDLVEEANKVREGLETANRNRFEELKSNLIALTNEAQEAQSKEMNSVVEGITILAARLAVLEQESEARKDMARRAREKKEAAEPVVETASDAVGEGLPPANVDPGAGSLVQK
jgi:cell division protein FtsX